MNSLANFSINNFFQYGQFDLIRCSDKIKFKNVLDVGFGLGGASLYFKMQEKNVTSIGLELDSYQYPKEALASLDINVVETSLEDFQTEKKFDAIWASHVIEHTQNVGFFLEKLRNLLSDDGWLMVIVPGYDPRILGGHINIGWTLGSLMYNLLVSGFDIKNGHFINDRNAITAFVKKSNIPLPKLRMDNGDIENTAHLWPFDIKQGDDGSKLMSINWFEDYQSLIKNQYNVEKFSKFLYKNLFKQNTVQKKLDTFFDKHKNKKIGLYPTGLLAQELNNNYNLNGKITCFVDKNKAGNKLGNFHIYCPTEVNLLDLDVIAITHCEQESLYNFIKEKNLAPIIIKDLFAEENQ